MTKSTQSSAPAAIASPLSPTVTPELTHSICGKVMLPAYRSELAVSRTLQSTADNLAIPPKVFLLDEPLSNLDAKLRVQMRVELEGLHKQLSATTVYVTHDQVEAMTMADKIVVLNAGRIEQVGTPLDLYHAPRSRFVAEFIGSPAMNVVPSTAGLTGLPLHAAAAYVGCRPEHLELVPRGEGHADATVKVKEQLGGESLLYFDIAGGTEMVARVDGDDATEVGQIVSLRIPDRRLHQFDSAGSAL